MAPQGLNVPGVPSMGRRRGLSVPGAAGMPSGAVTLLYADQAVTVGGRKAIPNALSATPVDANPVNFPRRTFSRWQSTSCTCTDNVAAGPDGQAFASSISAAAVNWAQALGPGITLPAGTHTMFLDVKRNAGTDQPFIMGAGGTLGSGLLATSTWTTKSLQFTLGSPAGTTFRLWRDTNQACEILIDNFRIAVSSTVDPGATVHGGHLLLGYTAYDNAPTVSSNAFDLADLYTGSISFNSAQSLTDFTVFAVCAKTTSSTSANQTILSTNRASPSWDPTVRVETAGVLLNGVNTNPDTNGYYPNGMFSYNGEAFKIVTVRVQSGILTVWVNGLLVGQATANSVAADFNDMLVGWYAGSPGFSTGYKFHAIGIYPRALTAAEINTKFLVLQSRGAALGTPVTIPTRRMLLANGDSITAGAFIASGYVARYGVNSSPRVYGTDRAISGSRLSDMVTKEAESIAFLPSVKEAGFKAIYYCMIGTNDSCTDGTSPASYAASLGAHFARMKAAGYNYCVAGTVISNNNPTTTTNRNIFNPIITGSTWKTTYGVDATVDFSSEPLIGADGAYSNTTYFSDGVHPTDAGAALMEPVFRPVINALP